MALWHWLHEETCPYDTIETTWPRSVPVNSFFLNFVNLKMKALEAMVKFSEVRAKRERVFYKNRMSGNRERQIEADRKLVEENQVSKKNRICACLAKEF